MCLLTFLKNILNYNSWSWLCRYINAPGHKMDQEFIKKHKGTKEWASLVDFGIYAANLYNCVYLIFEAEGDKKLKFNRIALLPPASKVQKKVHRRSVTPFAYSPASADDIYKILEWNAYAADQKGENQRKLYDVYSVQCMLYNGSSHYDYLSYKQGVYAAPAPALFNPIDSLLFSGYKMMSNSNLFGKRWSSSVALMRASAVRILTNNREGSWTFCEMETNQELCQFAFEIFNKHIINYTKSDTGSFTYDVFVGTLEEEQTRTFSFDGCYNAIILLVNIGTRESLSPDFSSAFPRPFIPYLAEDTDTERMLNVESHLRSKSLKQGKLLVRTKKFLLLIHLTHSLHISWAVGTRLWDFILCQPRCKIQSLQRRFSFFKD